MVGTPSGFLPIDYVATFFSDLVLLVRSVVILHTVTVRKATLNRAASEF